MFVLKQFRAGLFGLALLFVMALLPGCPNPSNHCSTPNPIIKFEAISGSGFSVTPGKVPQSSTVKIEVTGKNGTPVTTFSGPQSTTHVIHLDSTFQRPLQLKFSYLSASNKTIAEDSIQIDDTQIKTSGIPDMDVVLGVTGLQNCPSSTQSVTPTINNGVASFPWTTGDQFEVHFICGAVTEKIRLQPEPNSTQGEPGTVHYYKLAHYSCLTSPNTSESPNKKEMTLTNSNNSKYYIRAYDNNTGGSRYIEITLPAGCNTINNIVITK